MKIQVNDTFQQAWSGCKNPMWFKVLSVNRNKNSLEVECHSFDGYVHNEEWDDLDLTENAFDIGEYKLLDSEENQSRRN